MKRNPLLNSLPLVAKALGDKMGVKVQIGGSGAWTDGKIINIPSLPEDDQEAAILARGFLDHESSHIRYTQLEGVPFQPETFEHSLCNILEDVRTEALMGQKFPGCRINLEERLTLLVGKGALAFPEEGEIPAASAFKGWLFSKLLYEVLGRAAIKPVYEDGQEIMEEIFPPHLMTELEKLTDEGKNLASTEEAVKLTEKILSTLQDWADNPPPPPEQNSAPDQQEDESQEDESEDSSGVGAGSGTPDESENGQDEEDNSESSESDSGDGDSQGGTPDTSNDADDDAGSGTSGSNQENKDPDDDAADNGVEQDKQAKSDPSESDDDAQSGGQGAGRGASEDVTEAIRQILSAGADEGKEWDLGNLLKEALEECAQGCTSPSILLPSEEKPLKGAVDLASVRQATSALRSRLTGLVQASRHQASFPKRSGRRVDGRYLSRLAHKDPRVFASKLEQTAVNTAVMILLDRSGSMNSRIDVAKDAVLAAALALDAIPGVAVASAAFPGRTEHGGMETITPLTRFGQSVRGTSSHYGIRSCGGTPLAEALWWTATQIMGRPEPRKIILVATDGDPNDPDATDAVIRRLEAEGAEVLGLGINSQHVRNYFQTWEVIHNIKELPQAMFGMLQKKLVAKAS